VPPLFRYLLFVPWLNVLLSHSVIRLLMLSYSPPPFNGRFAAAARIHMYAWCRRGCCAGCWLGPRLPVGAALPGFRHLPTTGCPARARESTYSCAD
jgi:hypothetical protein